MFKAKENSSLRYIINNKSNKTVGNLQKFQKLKYNMSINLKYESIMSSIIVKEKFLYFIEKNYYKSY